MANYLVTDSDLNDIADAIREKGDTSSGLVFPEGFITSINNIPTDGGREVYLYVDKYAELYYQGDGGFRFPIDTDKGPRALFVVYFAGSGAVNFATIDIFDYMEPEYYNECLADGIIIERTDEDSFELFWSSSIFYDNESYLDQGVNLFTIYFDSNM